MSERGKQGPLFFLPSNFLAVLRRSAKRLATSRSTIRERERLAKSLETCNCLYGGARAPGSFVLVHSIGGSPSQPRWPVISVLEILKGPVRGSVCSAAPIKCVIFAVLLSKDVPPLVARSLPRKAPFQWLGALKALQISCKICFYYVEGLPGRNPCMLKQGVRLGMTVTHWIVFSYERRKFKLQPHHL